MKTFDHIEAYLQAHGLLTLATVNEKCMPIAHSVEYIHEGNTVYFISNHATRKIANIKNNANVSYTVDEDYKDWSVIQGIQMIGKASIVDDPKEVGRLMKIYAQKFPQVMSFPSEFVEAMRVVRIEPFQARYIDNTQGMGYAEELEY